jgi:hypothetical protein
MRKPAKAEPSHEPGFERKLTMSSTSLKRKWIVGGVTILVAAAATTGLLWRGFHEGGAHNRGDHHGSAALTLNYGKKWTTDQSLRGGMQQIAALIAPLTDIDDSEPLDPEQAAKIAFGVREQVNDLISNCKLDPKADAALHVLIADMFAGADVLMQPAPSMEGVRIIREALELYPQYFEHPDWKPMESSS